MSGTARVRQGQPRDERGSGTFLTLAGVICIVAATWLWSWIAAWIGCVHQARSSADLAALAGADAYVRGADACQAARQNAQRNGASVVSCTIKGTVQSFTISVDAAVPLRPHIAHGPSSTVASAIAGTGMK